MKTLAQLADLFVCTANDMKHIHLHAVGKQFDRIHSIAGDYYEQISKDYDTVAELALQYDEKVDNPTIAATVIKYEPTTEETFDYNKAVAAFSIILSNLVKCITSVHINEKLSLGTKSVLENLLEYYEKQLCYINKHRKE